MVTDGASGKLSPSSWGELAYVLLRQLAPAPWQVRLLDHYSEDLQEPEPMDRARALSVILAILLRDPASGCGEGAMT